MFEDKPYGPVEDDVLEAVRKYKPRPDDIFIVTFARCGTTWMQHIVHLILHKGEPFESFLEFNRASPFLEMTGLEAVENMPRPGAIKTHLPFTVLPFNQEAKYIYIARNPKDCCVSNFYHMTTMRFSPMKDIKFEDFSESFLQREIYSKHLLSWYKHRDDPNILFLTFEEMKPDTRGIILKVAKFLGSQYYDMLRLDEEIMNKIIFHSSFDEMKKLNKQMDVFAEKDPEEIKKDPSMPDYLKKMFLNRPKPMQGETKTPISFVRKGIIGNWKDHFTHDQARHFDEKFAESVKDTDIMKIWKDL
ncbi:sulfotransferase family cytosolic 1B member 1-like [Limulus polyphemus]|uniref:Sulfotransferase family cytosolic 1B member 1-like n=1 Tax=Limulus polyphemus TaxID=6850 RepID=A0ABM1BZ79_LIMPO|nr:sulfotransferase family cytosolic 1B member 1-like [Limulus polyphemus]XP_022235166.1 sulfotransferase family cytosolic 1B member 1-like [Limulus polyphemus]